MIYSILSKIKSKTVAFTNFLMPIIRYNFRKTWWSDLLKSLKVIIFLGLKMAHLPPFWATQEFFSKKGLINFKRLLNPNFTQKNSRKVIRQSEENSITDRQADQQGWDTLVELGVQKSMIRELKTKPNLNWNLKLI